MRMEQVLIKSKPDAPNFDMRSLVVEMIEELMMTDDDLMASRLAKVPEVQPSLSEGIDLLKIER